MAIDTPHMASTLGMVTDDYPNGNWHSTYGINIGKGKSMGWVDLVPGSILWCIGI
jgi:hypothetical protein